MKKLFSLCLLLTVTLSLLMGCGSMPPKIDRGDWALSYVLDEKDNILFVSSERAPLLSDSENHPILEATLSAKGGDFTITDTTNGKTYTGTYSDIDVMSPDAVDYKVKMGKTKGRALVLIGYDEEEDPVYTLSITVGDYTMVFVPQK